MRCCILIIVALLFQIKVFSQNRVSTNGVKNVLLEHTAGTWSDYIPDAIAISDDIKATYPVTIIARHHSGDGMHQNTTSQYVSSFSGGGYPAGSVDRRLFLNEATVIISRGVWKDYVLIQSQRKPKFDVDITYSYDSADRELIATVEATPLVNVQGQYAVNLFVIEDSVTGSGSPFNQKNRYDTLSTHKYYGAGNPIVGFYHMNVVRDVLGGTFGDVLSNLTTNVKTGKTYAYKVPAIYNAKQIRLIGIVSKYDIQNPDDCEVENSVQTDNDLYCSYLTPEAKLCMVTVDSVSGKNLLVWKPTAVPIKNYRIYRKAASNNYQLVGSAPNTTTSFIDVNSTPNANSHDYKLTVVDSCDKEILLDSVIMHSTIFATYSVVNNVSYISWNSYSGNGILSYIIKRSNNSGPFVQVAQLSPNINSYQDINKPTGVNVYRIEAELQDECNYNSTSQKYIYSNVVTAWPASITKVNKDIIDVYPNPTGGVITIKGLPQGNYNITVCNLVGQQLISKTIESSTSHLDVNELPKGGYILKAFSIDNDTQYITKFNKL